MLRQILIQLALFLVPFAVYAVMLKLRARGGTGPSDWSGAPWAWLGIGGLLLTAAGFAVLATFTDDHDGTGRGRYVPTHIENGVLVPGRFEK